MRQLADKHPIALVNSVNEYRIEGQKTSAFEICDELGEAPDALCIPVGNAGNVTAYWRGFEEYGVRPRLYGFQAEGAAPLVHGAPVEAPETVASAIRIGNPARWEEAMGAFTGSRGQVRAVSDEQILDAYDLLAAREGVFCEPASAASVAGLLAHGAEGRVVCVLTGHGLKDPQTAMNRASSVIPCEPDIASVEAAVLERVNRHRIVKRAGVLGQPRARVRRAGGRAVDRARAGGARDGRVLGDLRHAGRAAGPHQPVRARLREAAPRRRPVVRHPVADPAVGRPGLQRRRASWPGWPPPTTCSSWTRRCTSTRASWRATPTTSPPRCTAAS